MNGLGVIIFFGGCGRGVRQMVAGYVTLFVPGHRRHGISFIWDGFGLAFACLLLGVWLTAY